MSVIPDDPTGEVKPVKRDGIPDARSVNDFHTNDDTNKTLEAHHHTIGINRNKVSSGIHDHTGKDSRKIAANRQDLILTGKLSPTTVGEVDAIVDSLVSLLKNVINFQDNRV